MLMLMLMLMLLLLLFLNKSGIGRRSFPFEMAHWGRVNLFGVCLFSDIYYVAKPILTTTYLEHIDDLAALIEKDHFLEGSSGEKK